MTPLRYMFYEEVPGTTFLRYALKSSNSLLLVECSSPLYTLYERPVVSPGLAMEIPHSETRNSFDILARFSLTNGSAFPCPQNIGKEAACGEMVCTKKKKEKKSIR